MSALPPIADIMSDTARQKTPERFRRRAFRPRTKLIRRFASASSASEQPQRAEAGREGRRQGAEWHSTLQLR